MPHLVTKDEPIMRMLTLESDEGPAKYFLLADIVLQESESEKSDKLFQGLSDSE